MSAGCASLGIIMPYAPGGAHPGAIPKGGIPYGEAIGIGIWVPAAGSSTGGAGSAADGYPGGWLAVNSEDGVALSRLSAAAAAADSSEGGSTCILPRSGVFFEVVHSRCDSS